MRIHTDLIILGAREGIASQTVKTIDLQTISITRYPPTNAHFTLAAVEAGKCSKCAVEYWGREHSFKSARNFLTSLSHFAVVGAGAGKSLLQ